MNLPFDNAQLAAGAFVNDLPTTLPDPATGIPPSNVRNPLERTYTVDQLHDRAARPRPATTSS